MRKKYDKVDLRSDNYKARKTPEKHLNYTTRAPLSKSPSNQPKLSPQKIDPNSLFQKVCCPNCRYLFKIIKNQIFAQPIAYKKSTYNNISIQTEQVFSKQLKSMPKISYEANKIQPLSIPESSIFKTSFIKHNTLSKSQVLKQADHLKLSTYQFPNKSPPKNKSMYKLSSVDSQNISQSSLFETSKTPKNSFGLNKKIQIGLKEMNKIEQMKPVQQINEPNPIQVHQQILQEVEYQLQLLLSSQLRTTKSIDHLTSFCAELPASVEIPSFCKMLISDYSIPTKLRQQYIPNDK